MSKQKIYINGIPVWITNTGEETQFIIFENKGTSSAINVRNSIGIREQYRIVLEFIIDIVDNHGEIRITIPKDEK